MTNECNKEIISLVFLCFDSAIDYDQARL